MTRSAVMYYGASPAAERYVKAIVLITAFLLVFLLGSFYGSREGPSSLINRQAIKSEAQAPLLTESIPKKIWYKLGPNGLNDDTRAWTNSCVRDNPEYDVEFMTESSADAFVRHTFTESHPDLVEIYLGLRIPILKADILRYLLLFSEGGIYLDLDVSCEIPINEWIPPQHEHDTSLIVGWEFDMGWGDNIVREFATWAMLARPGSPHLWRVVEDILQSLRAIMADNNAGVSDLTLDMVGDVVDATGPRRFTKSVVTSLVEASRIADERDIHNLLEPRLVGNVLVLPGFLWAASANSYDGTPETVPPPLLTHHYAGTWKNAKGGE